jgi:isopentenyldiphosphate isomerase
LGEIFCKTILAWSGSIILEEEGRTIGTVTRREMRQRRFPHRCVYVLVFNGRGVLFVHLRTATKDVYPSHWDVAIESCLPAAFIL